MFLRYPVYLAFPVCCFMMPFVFSPSACSNAFLQENKEYLIETHDGMVLAGKLIRASSDEIQIDSGYGELAIPLPRIYRINGEQFLIGQGIVREHSILLQQDGSAILEYIMPLSVKNEMARASILIEGTLVEITDPDGNRLSSVAKGVGDFTRCTVNLPQRKPGALRIKVLVKTLVKQNQGLYTFQYHYVPGMNQKFHLDVKLPSNASVLQISPHNYKKIHETVIWEQSLNNQSQQVFEVTYQIQ